MAVINDVEHYLLRCPDIIEERRDELRYDTITEGPHRYDSTTDNRQMAGEGAGLPCE